MAKILIASKAYDAHSMLIQISLEQKGHEVIRWIGDDFPEKQQGNFAIKDSKYYCGSLTSATLNLPMDGIDVVWLRRPQWPIIPEYAHVDDKEMADQECRQFISSFWQAGWDNATWVNTLDGRRRANSKISQLKEASKLDFFIPETLISNDSEKVANFVEKNKNNVIVKPLLGGHIPDEHNKFRDTYTSEINSELLPNSKYIQICPAIYQEKIQKQFEVRVTFFGTTAIAVMIDSQRDLRSSLDWRVVPPKSIRMKEILLPKTIYTSCRKLMSRLGIIFGAFDFAVDHQNHWYFFEVNEAGQFLWIEDCVPEIHLLEVATQFLASPSENFIFEKSVEPISINKIENSTKYRELWNQEKLFKAAHQMTALV